MNTFRKTHFPASTARDWNDWRWQLRNRIRDLAGLERVFDLSDDEREAVRRHRGALPVGITPYYAALVAQSAALRKTMIPVTAEYIRSPGEREDPLGEEDHSPVPGLVHTYPDKVLFLVTDFCATYCRYCTRSRMVGAGEYLPDRSLWERAIAYIESRREVRDVLLSGGDPLILSDERLEWLLKRLHAIPHVEFLRIGTKLPAVLPQRITPSLVRMLRKYHPLFMSLHVMHPAELTPDMKKACERLADAGIPLGSQSVLLAGVNDDLPTLKSLMQGLLRMRVKPYYLHQCDAVAGSAHFRVPIAKGVELIRGLHGHTTGYAVPTYMLDAPGGGGKVPLTPQYIVDADGPELIVQNYRGSTYRYFDPETACSERHATRVSSAVPSVP